MILIINSFHKKNLKIINFFNQKKKLNLNLKNEFIHRKYFTQR